MAWMLHAVESQDINGIDSLLREWEPLSGCASGFQSGDLGWALRHGATTTARDLRRWIDAGGTTGAIGFLEDPTALWLTIDPARLMDGDLAEAIAKDAINDGLTEVGCASTPSSIRVALGRRGFEIDSTPWVHLWKSLVDDDLIEIPGVVTTSSEALIQQRIAVEQSAFENSTFSGEKWRQLAVGPSFRPELDLLAVDEAGEGVAALTAWLPGEGKCGMIEPMGTRADRRREGHGRRVLLASFCALRRLGASGVRVFAVRGNEVAVATYKAVGFRVIDLDTTMVREHHMGQP